MDPYGAQGLSEALLPAYSGETVWASHPLRVAAGVSADVSRYETTALKGSIAS